MSTATGLFLSSFLLWSKTHLIGKAKVLQEWSDARKHLHKSQHQTLREAAVRLDKAWASGVDEKFETNFFKEQQAKRQLMNGRLTVHAAADNVIVKRQRIELEEEGRSLDEGLQTNDLPTERDASGCEREDDLMAGQITPTKRVQGHSDIVPLVKDLTASFHHDGTSTSIFSLSYEDQDLYNAASEWFRTKVGRDAETAIQNVRKDQFREPWVHDLLYDR
ncbi:hypothetical protein K457DRAFT_522241 [Linnemannia elongata AG-77]|uniref:Uncharacterized protein n=1 Tax=Linnemannia elongata AG-77 TaxID=1314771 RepID=A0A197JYK5_9FUNG|nr:hypothetical protein K457DRAFT_522241 [Linnemannia elongata AG-77]